MHIHTLQKDGKWHCFFFTFSDVQGAHWQAGHLHYCSSDWYSDIQTLLSELKQKRHSVRSVHVEFNMSASAESNT